MQPLVRADLKIHNQDKEQGQNTPTFLGIAVFWFTVP
jgi:hypothetical protein